MVSGVAFAAPASPATSFIPSEVGPLPSDWQVSRLGALLQRPPAYGINAPAIAFDLRFPAYIRITDITDDGRFNPDGRASVSHCSSDAYHLTAGDIVLARTGASTGKSYLYRTEDGELVFAGFLIRVSPDPQKLLPAYLSYQLQTSAYWNWVRTNSMRSGQPGINGQQYAALPIPLPPTVYEQQAIAAALTDADALIEALESLIAKKRAIKQGAMQELLCGRRRLAGFEGDWIESPIEQVADCLDSLRVPLNDAQRQDMKGDYPYCGANGILDYIDEYRIEDSVILMAEDGGYFDEYETRPIAYRMSGRFWVNNHAHILKAKPATDQDFLFYALVHKNILPFLASGTRAKLNKSEMNKILVKHPVDRKEQFAISTVLNALDEELASIADRLAKARQIKQGMMQELLTGRVRLV